MSDDTEYNQGAADSSFSRRADESPDQRTVASRQHLRDKLAGDVEAFLAGGGSISRVDRMVTGEMPGKPGGDYGSRPI